MASSSCLTDSDHKTVARLRLRAPGAGSDMGFVGRKRRRHVLNSSNLYWMVRWQTDRDLEAPFNLRSPLCPSAYTGDCEPSCSRPTGRPVQYYRAYIMDDDGHIMRAVEVHCEDDESSKEHTRPLVNGHDVELWAGVRKVAIFPKRSCN